MTLTTKQQPVHKVMNSRLLEVSINQFQNKIWEYGMLEYWIKGLFQAHCTFFYLKVWYMQISIFPPPLQKLVEEKHKLPVQ